MPTWLWIVLLIAAYAVLLCGIWLVIHGGKKHGDDTRWKR